MRRRLVLKTKSVRAADLQRHKNLSGECPMQRFRKYRHRTDLETPNNGEDSADEHSPEPMDWLKLPSPYAIACRSHDANTSIKAKTGPLGLDMHGLR